MVKYVFFVTGYLANSLYASKLVQALLDNDCQGVGCTTFGDQELIPFKDMIDVDNKFDRLDRGGTSKAPNWGINQITDALKGKYQQWYATIKDKIKHGDSIVLLGHSLGALSVILLGPSIQCDKIIVMNPYYDFPSIPRWLTFPLSWIISKLPLSTYFPYYTNYTVFYEHVLTSTGVIKTPSKPMMFGYTTFKELAATISVMSAPGFTKTLESLYPKLTIFAAPCDQLAVFDFITADKNLKLKIIPMEGCHESFNDMDNIWVPVRDAIVKCLNEPITCA
jgi:hypothetical protein